MLSRRLPGCSWESFTYNDADQIVTHTWDDKTVTTTYDALQRPSSETLTANGTSRLLSQYTYDTYDSSASTLLNLSSLPSSDSRTMGLKTSERLAVLGTSATDYVTRAYAYDYKGRTIRTAEQYPDGSLLRTDTDYDFSGNVTSLTQQYTHGGTTDTQITTYTYDSRGRLLSETSRLNNGTAGIVNYSYDDQGRVSGKRYGSNLANESLSYGIQGWRTTQCVMQGVDSLFTTRLGYYNPHYGSRQSYTGNITESDWHHRAQPYQSYTFEYDGLNRLRTTRQYTGGAISDSDIEYPQYYDLNGNPQTLYRNSQGVRVTNYTYTYTGNQLTTLSDGSVTYSYTYDSRGNMTRDGYHNLNLAYNHLNLLEKVSQNGSTVANYSYLSDGTKLSTVNSSGVGFVYRGSLVYGKSGSMLSLESCGFGGGRLISASGSSTPHYYVTDHLGSVRVVLNNSGDIVSQHDYYPFGKSHDNPNLQTSPNRYLFNGKESQTFANVPYLDYGARMYDADIIRWKNLDPLLWKYFGISPFAFCLNNPLKYVDDDGRVPRVYVQSKGLGHAFVTVGEGRNTTVYSYGRYGAVRGSSGVTSGRFTPKGEGVLWKKTGESAAKFLNGVKEEGNFSVYEIGRANDKTVANYYDSQIENGSRPTDSNKESYSSADATVVDEYSLSGNNCVTKTIDGINAGGEVLEKAPRTGTTPDGIPIYNPITSPRELSRTLDKNTGDDIIKVADPEKFIEELNTILK